MTLSPTTATWGSFSPSYFSSQHPKTNPTTTKRVSPEVKLYTFRLGGKGRSVRRNDCPAWARALDLAINYYRSRDISLDLINNAMSDPRIQFFKRKYKCSEFTGEPFSKANRRRKQQLQQQQKRNRVDAPLF